MSREMWGIKFEKQEMEKQECELAMSPKCLSLMLGKNRSNSVPVACR